MTTQHNKIKSQAFTLVELIVVVTILAILGTIGFISYNGYLVGVRDSNRTTQLQEIAGGLELYRVKNTLPLPSASVSVKVNGTIIGYQGYAGQDQLDLIDYSKGGKDPKDGEYFTYYLTADRKKYQLLGFLEDSTNQTAGIWSTAYAADYSVRFPTTTGKKLGVLLETSTNIPIQIVGSIVSSGTLDIGTTTNTYTAQFSDKSSIVGTGGVVSAGIVSTLAGTTFKSCKDILSNNPLSAGINGTYTINTFGTGTLQVYCDMTMAGGGWTFFGHINGDSGGTGFFGGTGAYQSNRVDNGTKYSFSIVNFPRTEMMVTLDTPDSAPALTQSKIVFYSYPQSYSGFTLGPIPCVGLLTGGGFSYKLTPAATYIPSSIGYCASDAWYPYSSPGGAYLILTHLSALGDFWGGGVGGDNTWSHDGWWYVR